MTPDEIRRVGEAAVENSITEMRASKWTTFWFGIFPLPLWFMPTGWRTKEMQKNSALNYDWT
jgi:hypothetical protein